MANEATLSASLRMSKGGVDITMNVTQQADVSGTAAVRKTQSIGTGAREVLDLGDITAPGLIMGFNRGADDGRYVEIYPDGTEAPTIKVSAQMPFGPIELASGALAPQARAFNSACMLEYFVTDQLA
jgi:hypothetical protein